MFIKKLISVFAILLLILTFYGCSGGPLDKKFVETNYREILIELKDKRLITKGEYIEMEEKIFLIIMGKQNDREGIIHLTYGVPYENLTYKYIRDYNSDSGSVRDFIEVFYQFELED